jgi:hypothetical protein
MSANRKSTYSTWLSLINWVTAADMTNLGWAKEWEGTKSRRRASGRYDRRDSGQKKPAA